jgi:hypothetical protein
VTAFVIRGEPRIAAIADSLRAVAPITMQQLREVDPLTFAAINDVMSVASIVAPTLGKTRLSRVVVEVVDG